MTPTIEIALIEDKMKKNKLIKTNSVTMNDKNIEENFESATNELRKYGEKLTPKDNQMIQSFLKNIKTRFKFLWAKQKAIESQVMHVEKDTRDVLGYYTRMAEDMLKLSNRINYLEDRNLNIEESLERWGMSIVEYEQEEVEVPEEGEEKKNDKEDDPFEVNEEPSQSDFEKAMKNSSPVTKVIGPFVPNTKIDTTVTEEQCQEAIKKTYGDLCHCSECAFSVRVSLNEEGVKCNNSLSNFYRQTKIYPVYCKMFAKDKLKARQVSAGELFTSAKPVIHKKETAKIDLSFAEKS